MAEEEKIEENIKAHAEVFYEFALTSLKSVLTEAESREVLGELMEGGIMRSVTTQIFEWFKKNAKRLLNKLLQTPPPENFNQLTQYLQRMDEAEQKVSMEIDEVFDQIVMEHTSNSKLKPVFTKLKGVCAEFFRIILEEISIARRISEIYHPQGGRN